MEAATNYYQMKNIGLGYSAYGIGITLMFPENSSAIQVFPCRGRGEATINKIGTLLEPGRGLSISPDTRFAIRADADYEHSFLRANTLALTDKLVAITGASINRPLKFHAEQDHTHKAAKALRDHVSFLIDKVSTSAEPLPHLVSAEFEQLLMVMLLHANRHNYSHLMERAAADAAPVQVRRAEAYIEANWRQVLTLENLAAVSGVSMLCLFRSFRESRGYSPLEFANRVRLGHARELLQHPDASTTVAAVAIACGFSDVHRFANDYIATFGEQPWSTLLRA